MKKKLMMLCVAAMAAIGAWAATEMVNGVEWTYQVSGGSATITDVPTSISNRVEIPQSLNGYQVTGIRSWAFSGCNRIKSINIPSSVTSIGDGAFSGCSSLTDIVIPLSVRTIGSSAFSNCSSLEYLTIPVSVSKIEDYTFEGCIGLKEITLPVTITAIGSRSFYGCSALQTLEVPFGVKSIGSYAFYGCSSLTSITFPYGLTTISSEAFYGCGKLTSLDIPSTVTSVGYDAFDACGGLRNVTISSDNVFYYNPFGDSCRNISSLTLGEGVTRLPSLYNWSKLTTLSLPASIKGIYEYDISRCSSLTTISVAAGNPYYKVSGGLLLTKDGSEIVAVPKGRTWVDIPDSVTSIPMGMFDGCEHLYAEHSIPGLRIVDGWVVGCDWYFGEDPRPPSILNLTGVRGIAEGVFYDCNEGLKNVIIGEGVRTIGTSAFKCCYDLESISISSSVRSIGENAFSCCFRLKSITVASGNAAYEFTGGLLISKDKTQLVAVSREVSTVKIPEGVREIPDGFFAGCNKLTSVSIPSSIDEYGIGSEGSVFSYWYERYDEMTDEWYEETIGCPNLKTITVASGNPYYKSIGGMLCSVYDDEMSLETVPQALTDVIIPEGVTDVDSETFEGCAKLNTIKVASGNRNYKSVNGLLLTKDGKKLVWVPNALTSVTIPDGVVDLGWAFDGCEKLTSVKIPDSVVAVGRYTFGGCPESLFDKKTIPGCIMVDGWIVGVTDEAYERYGENGEEWNLDLTKARGVADRAFTRTLFGGVCDDDGYTGISGLHSIVIPKNIIAVGDEAFCECGNLSSVTIESGVRHIAATAFYECHESLYDDTTLPGFILVDGWLIAREYYYDDSIKSLDLTGLRGVAGRQDVNFCCGMSGSLFAYGVTNLVVGDGMTAISHGAFAYSYELEEVEIADSVAVIGENAFLYCRNLKRVKMPDSLRGKVPASAFSQCSPDLQIEYYKSIFTVEFDANYPPFSNHDGVENVIESRCVESGETIGALPTSVLSKYKFLGWYTAPEGGTKISATTKVTGNVTYYAQWVYDGSAIVSAIVAEGCEAMGKVMGGTTAKVGTKVTLKATANKGYVFAGWDGPLDDSLDPSSPSISYIVGEDDAEFVAYFIPVGEDWVDVWLEMDSEYTTGEEIDDIYVEVYSGSLATLKVKGLPTGLKYTAKPVYDRNGDLLHEANTIYGKPTKSGVYTVTVTATTAGKKTDTYSAIIVVRKDGERMVKLTVPSWYDYETDADVVPGKVTAAGIYAEGKKVTLKATANKGFVFAGWRDVNSGDWLYSDEDYRSPSMPYTMTDSDMEMEAVFIPVSEDWVYVGFWPDYEYVTNEEISDIYIDVDSGSLATIKVAGLPTGLKYTAKPVYDRNGDLLHEANTIYGTPKKSGVYTVTVTATTAGKKTDTCSAVIVVRKYGERMVKITVQTRHDGETDTDVIPGKVTGAGIYAEGKKVSLKATANKGFVFAGWIDLYSIGWISAAEDYRSPSLSYIMTDSDMEIEAVFEPIEYDDTLVAYVDGNEITSNATDNNFVAGGTTILPLEMESVSLPKAMVSGLPAGMKYTDKALTVKATKTEEAYDVPANAIYGAPTKPGLYTVTVKLTNTTIKKAIEKKFTIEVPNFTAANGYFVDNLDNGIGKKRVLSVGIINIDDFLPSLALNSGTAKLAVSGLPAGLKYDAANGKITGVATKAGTYTVTLTVTDGKAKYVSTITVEIKSLPDWVVGTFEGCFNESGWYNYSNYNKGRGSDWEAIGRFTVSVTETGKVTGKFVKAHETQSFTAVLVNVEENRYEFFADYAVKDGNGWDERGELSFAIVYDEYENTHCARIEGKLLGDENDDQDMPFLREFYGWRNLWNVKGISLPKVAKTTAYTMAYADEEYDIYGELSLSFSAGRNTVVSSFAFDDLEDQKTLKITKCTSQLIVTGYEETSGVFSVLLPVYMKHLDEPGDDEWIDLDFLIPMEIDIKGNVNILWDDVRYAHDDWW